MPNNLDEFISDDKLAERTKKLLIGKVADLVERSGIDVDEAVLKRAKLYQGMIKGEDGEPILTDMISVELTPSWAEGPAWPMVEPAKPVNVKYTIPAKTKGTAPDGYKTCVILPDIQGGYYRGADGELVPIHDEMALDVAMQILARVQPDLVIFLGDNADFAEASRYRLTPAFAQTTQATLERLNLLCAQVRAIIGDEAEIRWLEGNHEARLSYLILDNAKAAYGLKKAGNPDGWPVLSVPNLCNFDVHNVEYIAGYPANQTWINNRFRCIHGTHVVSNGSTAHKYLANERTSVAYGHIHRTEFAQRTRNGFDGPHTILAMSPGCLARVTGEVPSTKGGVDLDGRPVPVAEDWQQGIAIVTYQDGEGAFIPELVPIHDGFTIFRGEEIRCSEESKTLMGHG